MSANIPVTVLHQCPVSSILTVTQDDIKPAKEVIERSQAAEIARFAPSTDLWSLYLQEANERAKARFDMWNGSLGAFLLFAGLFAGVVSSFVIDSRAGLQPNPSVSLPSNSSNTNNPGMKVPASTLAINFLWFTSLTFTLISALAAVLAQTWIVKFSLVPTQGFKGAMERWIHDDKAEQWHLHTAIAWITVLIQLALFLFLAGFAVQAVADHKSLGWTILSFVGATLVLYIGITVLPWFYPTTPFRTPFSELGTRNQNMFFSDASNLTRATKAKNRTRDMWKFIQSIWTNLGKTPNEAEVRLGICWSVLKNSSKNVSIHAAVLELSKKRITPEQSRQLVELGLPDELSYRLAHLPAGQEKDVVERMKDYLHVVMWMVDECDMDVAQGFSPLLDCDDALLLALDALPPVCRALAFAIRVHLLVNMSKHGKIHGTDWTALIDSLEPDFALDVFRAAIRGLGIVNSDDDHIKPELAHLRQDCARMLAAYIGSARFSNERLVASRITGGPLRIPRIQQEPMKHIPTFFSQLEEAWKRSMCTRAIRLLEEVRSDRQIMGFQMLSSVAKNETFREAVNDVLPELGNTLQKVDWKTSVDCLGRLSEILKQDSRGTFRQAIKAIFPKIIGLLSDSGEEVRTAVLHLADQMDMQAWVVEEIDRISCDLMKDLWRSSWRARVARLQSLAELIKTGKISTAIIGQAQSIMNCTSFYDEDVRLAAIRTLQELAKHERFQLIIHNNMSEILRLVSDEDYSVRAAAIDFVSELAGNASFQSAINRNIPAFITDNFKSEDWFVRRGRLQALGKIITSRQSYDKGIQNAFRDMPNWLSDPDEDVRQTAVQIVSLAAGKAAFSDTIKNAIPKIAKMFQDEDEDVRVAALNTCSEVVKVQQAPLKETISRAIPDVLLALNSSSRTQIATLDTLSTLAATDDLTTAIPTIAKLFGAGGRDVRVAALGTCSEIAKLQRAALQNTIKNIMPEILAALNSSSGWETQIAALKTISTLAETDGLCETLNDNVLDRIFAGLSDNDSDVRIQVLDTLTVLASKERFHDKIKTNVRNMLPLLEDWRWTVREKALDTFAVFAQHGIFLASDDEITSHIISTLSEGDNDISTRVLNILSIAAKEGVAPVVHPEISLVTNSLSHQNWRVRVAGLQVLESLADDTKYGKISFPAQATIVDCLSDKFEEVQLAGLRTLFKFIDNEIFRDRVTVPDTVPAVISSLLKSDSEDIRISAINIISAYITKAEFYSVIIGVMPAIINLLDGPDEDSRVVMLQTVCSLANTEKFCTKDVFVEAIRHILPLLLSNRHAAVRMAALQIVPVISKHDIFGEIITDSLQVLLKVAARKEDLAGTVEEVDEIFRIEVLKTLSDLAKNETFRGKIDIGLSDYALATKDGSWPTRVAFLKLMSVLGASAKDALKSTVKQMMPDINDTLHDNENNEVRMAGVKLLSISVVKEISPSEFNSFVPTLVTLLSDSEEEVRITALQTVSDLAKQDVFREAINGTLPALLEALKREEPNTRVAALRTCAALAQDAMFCDIVLRAAPQITACVKDDPDDDVQVAAMVTLSRLSREEAFRLAVSEAAPHVMSQLGSGYWSVRLEALRTLSIFAENDAFGDIINGFFPRIVECLKDSDDDVRAEGSKMLLSLVQHSVYRDSIGGALQASGVPPLLDLTSDHFRHVRMAVLPLILKVVELDTFPEVAAVAMSTIIKLTTDDDEEVRIAALEAIRTLVEQGVSYAKELTPEIPKLTQLLKTDDSESRVLTTVLLTLSAMVTQEESVDTVMDVIPTIFSVFKDTKEPKFWDAAAKVFLALASTGGGPDDKVHKVISSCVTSALKHSNWRARILGLNVLLGLNDQEIFESEFNNCRPTVLELVESSDLDVRLLAIRVAGSFDMLDRGDGEKLHAATQKAWHEVLIGIKSTSPSVVASEKLSKLADYVDVFVDEEFTDVIPLITAALKDEHQGIALSYLRALLKLAANYRFREALVQVVPRITALLGNKKSDTQIRLEVLENLLKLAEYQKFRVKIQEQVSAIISVLKDRDSNIRVTGLKVLLKLVQEVSPEKFPDRIKSTMPTLLTLIQSVATREDSVALVTCLAGDKTLRAEVLTKILPSILSSSQSPTSWGHLCLIARLFEHKRLKLEESDLRFFLCLLTSKKTEVQDFVLKFMTTTLQRYLVETWMNAQTFPPSFSSAFSSLAQLKR